MCGYWKTDIDSSRCPKVRFVIVSISGNLQICNTQHIFFISFALLYFESNPAPFEAPRKNPNEPRKIKRHMTQQRPRKVSDYEIVEATYNILQASPEKFKYKWNWSKFLNFLTNEDDKVKW